MVNLYHFIKEGPKFRKLEVNQLLFAEYTCVQEETRFGIWSDSNYFAFVTSGKKMWRSIYHDYVVEKGDILFIKKGANLTHQFFEDEFCAIFFFLPDEFVKAFLQRHPEYLSNKQIDLGQQDAVLRIQPNEQLNNYCASVVAYLGMERTPDKKLLALKFEELLLGLFAQGMHHELTSYFVSLCQDERYHLKRVMEENFAYNLKIVDFAQLCHMSLSKFKSVFKEQYNSTPAAWLKARKLDLALHKLKNEQSPINQISLECGFEDPSHFIRVFKDKFKQTPRQFRQTQSI